MGKKKAVEQVDTVVNKSEFVRNQPADRSAKEVVEAAQKAGFSLSTAYVYTIRSSTEAKKPAAKRGRPPKATNGASDTVSASATNPIRDIIIRFGAERVKAELQSFETWAKG